LRFFVRACPELAEGVGGVLPAQLLSVLHYPFVDAVVVPALRKVREGRGTHSCGAFWSLKAGPPAELLCVIAYYWHFVSVTEY
jgi:hypothetical protein